MTRFARGVTACTTGAFRRKLVTPGSCHPIEGREGHANLPFGPKRTFSKDNRFRTGCEPPGAEAEMVLRCLLGNSILICNGNQQTKPDFVGGLTLRQIFHPRPQCIRRKPSPKRGRAKSKDDSLADLHGTQKMPGNLFLGNPLLNSMFDLRGGTF